MVLDRLFSRVVSLADRVVPKQPSIVVRTTPDISDQGIELLTALERRPEIPPVTWLVDDPGSPLTGRVRCRFVRARSFAATWAYLRASVVVHTHGTFGSQPASRRKRFLNLWHGMPIKRLERGHDVGRHQTDLTIATSPVHARHLADTWEVPLDRVRLTGLPRNDWLVRPRGSRPEVIEQLTGGRPLVIWLPTFRTTAAGPARFDGLDRGTVTQFAGASPSAIDDAMARHGVHCLVKSHPLAPRPEIAELAHLTIWSNQEMEAADLTIYQLLSFADALVTDHSSVWIDFLLTRRPIVFAISDRAEYSSTRGYYFDDLDTLLPGPIVADMDGLDAALGQVLASPDPWADRRRAALSEHHVHLDDESSERVADLVLELLDQRR